MANYFTDIVGGGREAFRRGYENVENIRRDIGEQQAARALARGDTRAAKQAYGNAGMAEQVDILGQREEAKAEAMRKRQEDMAETQRKRTIEDQDRAARLAEAQRKNAQDQLTALGDFAIALGEIDYPKRAEAWQKILRPAVVSMGVPQEILAQMDAADLTNDNLTLFARAMGQEAAKLKPQVSVGQYGATVYDPETGQARFVPAQGAPRAAAEAPAGEETGVSSAVRKEATALRKEFNARPEVKDYRAKASSVSNMKVFAGRNTPASDMSMIFLFMKMLDPTSVVREGEYANAQNAASIPDQVRNQYNKAIKGTGLNPRQRQDFLSQAQSILLNAETAYQGVQSEYGDYARISNIPSELIFQGMPAAQTPAAPRQGGFLLRPGAPGAPPPSPQARATGSRANPPPYATAEERELWSEMTPEEKAAVWAGE